MSWTSIGVFLSAASLSAAPVMAANRCIHTKQTNKKKEHMPNIAERGRLLTLYNTTQTKRLRGILKKLIMVDLISSGTC